MGTRVPCGTTPSRLTIVSSTSCRSAGIGKGLGRGPHPHDDVHRDATGRTVAHARGHASGRRVLAGVSLPHHEADRRERDGTAGMEQAEVPDFHKAFGQDVLEEPAEKFHDVELGGAEAGTAHFPVGEGDGTVHEAHDAAIGDGNFEDVGSEVGEGGGAVGLYLTVDIPFQGIVHTWGSMCASSPACCMASLKSAR